VRGPVTLASTLVLAALLGAATLGCDRGGGRQRASETVETKSILWAARSPLLFARPATDPTGADPYSAALGDLNGDGSLDLVVPTKGAGSVSVLTNRGNGTFVPERRYRTGSGPSSVALGDLDGDDGLDIVTANGGASAVSVLLNDGDGTFQSKTDYQVGIDSDPNSVALGELNGDGKLDVVTANFADGTVSALLNTGGGKLKGQMQIVYSTEGLISVAVNDLNGDGKADLVLTGPINKIFVLLNDGAGAFPDKIEYETGDSPVVATGDFDGDRKPDLAISTEDSRVSVLLNRGDGSFRPGGDYATGRGARSETMCERCVAIGDVNGDGKPDLVTANQGADTVSVLVNRGHRRFRAKRDYRTGTAPRSIAIGDLNGDGKPDLVSATAGSTVAVLANTTGAPATPIRRLRPGQPRGTIVFASDRSGDFEIYSVRADGSRLGRITRNRAQDTRPLFSPDGRRLAFIRGDSTSVTPFAGADLWVANADGSGERKLASYAHDPALAPDSERIAYTDLGGQLAITNVDGRRRVVLRGQSMRPSWSPDGRRLAVLRGIESPYRLMVVGSDGRGQSVIRSGIDYGTHGPVWSPAGDLIAFSTEKTGLNTVTPDGRGYHHLAWHADALAWSPDGRRIAFVAGARLYLVSSAGGAARDITPATAARLDAPAWSPDGRWLVVTSQRPEGQDHTLLVVAADGSRSRSLARLARDPYGSQTLWPTWRSRGATAQRLGRALPRRHSEFSSRAAFDTHGSIRAVAADGASVAVVVAYRGRTCPGVAVWTPASARVVHLRPPCRAGSDGPSDVTEVAMAADRVAWDESRVSMNLSTEVVSATMARRAPVVLGSGSLTDFFSGDLALGLHGAGSLLAFTVEEHCEGSDEFAEPRCPQGRKPGQVSSATVWRAAHRGAVRVASAKGELTVLAVDAGRIAARTDHGVRLLTGGGTRLRGFPVDHVRAAALSGDRIALRVPGAVEVYDTGSGELVTSLPMRRDRLEDIENGILVTATRRTVRLRRLGDGHTARIHTRGIPQAQLEPSGLFVADRHRVTFVPMADILRRLG
jgi:Tol biopolymer transport system component